jgi:hypothetical protein
MWKGGPENKCDILCRLELDILQLLILNYSRPLCCEK